MEDAPAPVKIRRTTCNRCKTFEREAVKEKEKKNETTMKKRNHSLRVPSMDIHKIASFDRLASAELMKSEINVAVETKRVGQSNERTTFNHLDSLFLVIATSLHGLHCFWQPTEAMKTTKSTSECDSSTQEMSSAARDLWLSRRWG